MYRKGFTILELVIVIAIVVVLMVSVFVLIQPAKRIGDTRDALRKSDTLVIKKALEAYAYDNSDWPASFNNLTANVPYMIVVQGGSTAGTANCTSTTGSIAKADIFSDIKSYLSSNPLDPSLSASSNETGYYITKVGDSFSIKNCYTYQASCGDVICSSTETCTTCPDDCGVCGGVAGSETIRPNAAGSETAITTQFPASTFHWDKVDEEVADDDTTYVKSGITWQRDLYALPAHTGSGTINSVTVYARWKTVGGGGSGKISIRTNGVTYDTSALGMSTSYVNVSNAWTTNPQTSAAWTWAEIDALEAGVYLYGWASLLRGQQVLMADGSQKNIEDVQVGEEIISFNPDTQKTEKDKVTAITQGSHEDYLIFNNTLKTSLNHVIWASGEFKEAKDIKIGDLLLDSKGNKVEITKIEYVSKQVETYDLAIEKNHNFFASNYLVHNVAPGANAYATQVYVVVDYTQ